MQKIVRLLLIKKLYDLGNNFLEKLFTCFLLKKNEIYKCKVKMYKEVIDCIEVIM